ncbi:enoyl-CoA hydratase [Thermocladium modestius]|uniref:Enoyl-CoA hydratase n=1 Tax=Thermocladium modestius TaxID=62609 RepID=A0A830GVJ8_9CREN|nr:enoyl-CoA hydratase/isomerase family protein [Thermocladium modestius]GGP20433.1 enoyl-CoA hydratase [Thermocladium modestius]
MNVNKKVLYRHEGDLSWIIFNRPDKLNAIDEESWILLNDYIEESQRDDSIAIAITGTGRAFSAGDDINSMLALSNKMDSNRFFANLSKAIKAMLNSRKPIIAVVNGLAYGGGCELLLGADVVIASSNAKFSIPEGRIGLIPPIAISIGYSAIGKSIIHLAITGRELSADDAAKMGLVDYVVPPEELMRTVQAIVDEIRKMDPESITTMKRYLNERRYEDLERAIKELAIMAIGETAKARMRKFIEERKRDQNKNRQ